MRRIHIPFSAQLDATGALTRDLRLEKTGDWRLVKVAAKTTQGYPQWDLLSTSDLVNSQFGPRCVMGPELLEPWDVLTLQIAGGDPNGAVVGTVSGLGGTAEEIVPLYAPQSAISAVDIAPPQRPWDWQVHHQGNQGDVNPAIAQPAISGVTLIVNHVSVTLINNNGTASLSAIVGVNETGPPSRTLMGGIVAVPATANTADRMVESDLALNVTPGVGVQVIINATLTNPGNFAFLNMGGYFA